MQPIATVLRQYEAEIRRWFSKRIMVREDVEDMVQETMLAILRSYARFEGRSSLRTWIYAICRNQWFRYQRRRTPEADRLTDEPADSRTGEALDSLEMGMMVEILPMRLRTVCELRFHQKMRVREIAAFTGRPEGTVKYQLYEIRRLLERFNADL